MTEIIISPEPEPILGVTHLLIDGKLSLLYRCPLCKFRNIFVKEIEHHIKFTHPDVEGYNVSDFYPKPKPKSEARNPAYEPVDKLPLLHCLWCKHQDRIEWDLAQHMYEKHRPKVYELPVSAQDRRKTLDLLGPEYRLFSKFEPAIEFRLDVAVMMSKKENRALGIQHAGVKHAIRQIQKRILKQQQQRERALEQQEIAEADNSNRVGQRQR